MYFSQERKIGIELKIAENCIVPLKFLVSFYALFFRNTYLSLINTPDVIISETSNGTRYAIATSTELNAIEKKHPQAVAIFITKIVTIAVIMNA